MGAARQGFNLRNKYGREAFRRQRWKHMPWGYVWKDTVMPLVCRVIGHIEYDCSDLGRAGEEFACRRCGQFTRTNYPPYDPTKYPQAQR